MNAKEFASLLDGRKYGHEITREEERLAKENGLLVVFGYSDDNVELRGMVDDEIGMYGGGECGIRMDKMRVVREDDCRDCLANTKIVTVKSEWAPGDLDCSWRITCDLGGEPFDIMDDGRLFCRGVVVDLSAFKGSQK